jgi:adenylyltransferase/sulfurtransferase
MPAELPIETDVRAVQQLRDAPDKFLLLDCRETDEFQTAQIAGAVLIPMKQLPARLSEIANFRDQRVVVLCHHGGRSLRVAQWLRQQGFSQAQSMAGGIDAWSKEIDASVPRY